MNEKIQELEENLKSMGSVLIAFSGGVDSTFLMAKAYEVLGKKAYAVTIESPYIPKWEIREAKEIAAKIGIRHEIVKAQIADTIRENPKNRCYLCKKNLFSSLLDLAKERNIAYVADGTNEDDLGDYRPGLVALQELDVQSPLLKAHMTKNDIRQASKDLGLPTWDKPPYACLLTRLPHGTLLDEKDFRMIEEAELFMMDQGFRAIRVRKHDQLARIEVEPEARERLFNVDLWDKIDQRFKDIGFKYVTIDASGYRMGSFNPKERMENE